MTTDAAIAAAQCEASTTGRHIWIVTEDNRSQTCKVCGEYFDRTTLWKKRPLNAFNGEQPGRKPNPDVAAFQLRLESMRLGETITVEHHNLFCHLTKAGGINRCVLSKRISRVRQQPMQTMDWEMERHLEPHVAVIRRIK